MKVRLSYGPPPKPSTRRREDTLHVEISRNAHDAVGHAARLLAEWIQDPAVRHLMVAGGNTPLPLDEAVAQRGLPVPELRGHVLDEYVGVPSTDPRTCTSLLRRTVAEAWGVKPVNFFGLKSEEEGALSAVLGHERRIDEAGGLDAIVLGLGRNGHLGFNEPGSLETSGARVLDLEATSIEANRDWFGGDYAPNKGATVGLRTILGARRVLLLAFGPAKADAVRAMLRGPRAASCPASFLQSHPGAHVFLDERAAAGLA
ncbi:MAG: 6-phosphogluconolactonase [Vicinamibacteria bacterium]